MQIKMQGNNDVVISVDMDGVLNEDPNLMDFDREAAAQPGYFKNLPVNAQMVQLINLLVYCGYNVRICSKLCDGETVKQDKKDWLKEYGVKAKHNVFVPSDKDKSEYMKDGVINILIDDYSKNLHEWEAAGGVGIKYYNGLNGNNGTWDGPSISKDMTPLEMAYVISKLIG